MSEKDSILPIPQQEGQQSAENEQGDAARGVADAESPSYRKAEEDATMLKEEERTGEGTGAKAGEYS